MYFQFIGWFAVLTPLATVTFSVEGGTLDELVCMDTTALWCRISIGDFVWDISCVKNYSAQEATPSALPSGDVRRHDHPKGFGNKRAQKQLLLLLLLLLHKPTVFASCLH